MFSVHFVNNEMILSNEKDTSQVYYIVSLDLVRIFCGKKTFKRRKKFPAIKPLDETRPLNNLTRKTNISIKGIPFALHKLENEVIITDYRNFAKIYSIESSDFLELTNEPYEANEQEHINTKYF